MATITFLGAAQEVTGATILILSSLVDRALLRRTNTGRYCTSDQCRNFQRNFRMNRDAALLGHYDVFSEGAEATVDINRFTLPSDA